MTSGSVEQSSSPIRSSMFPNRKLNHMTGTFCSFPTINEKWNRCINSLQCSEFFEKDNLNSSIFLYSLFSYQSRYFHLLQGYLVSHLLG